MQTTLELRQQFHNDIDHIALELIRSCNLKYKPENEELSDPLLRWLDFALRFVVPKPRDVFISSRLSKLPNKDVVKHLLKMKAMFSKGEDVNPYQSASIKRMHDPNNKKKHQRTDLLWADWGIHHFHLTNKETDTDRYFSNRSDWLLFALIGFDYVCLLDVRKHDEPNLFSNRELLGIIQTNWPEIMDQFELKGCLPPHLQAGPNADEIRQIRYSGMTIPLTFGDKVYMGPGMGITTAGMSTKVLFMVSRISNALCELADLVSDENGFYKHEAHISGINAPRFSVILTNRGLALYEEVQDKAYLFPRATGNDQKSSFAELHEHLLPEWMMKLWNRDLS